MNALAPFWNARSSQEKTLIASAGVLLVLALVFTILVEPALAARSRLTRDLQVLRGELAVMQVQAGEAQQLAPAAQGTTLSGEALRNSLTDLAHQHGLTAIQLTPNGGGVRAQASGVSFADWIEWLDESRHQNHVRASEVHVVGLPDGRVDTQVQLDPS